MLKNFKKYIVNFFSKPYNKSEYSLIDAVLITFIPS